MNAQEFYEMASQPEFSNTMAFEIKRPEDDDDPERSFSPEGIEAIGKQIAGFMAARVLGHYRHTGQMPKQASVIASVKLDGPDVADGMFPHYNVVDGEHRSGS